MGVIGACTANFLLLTVLIRQMCMCCSNWSFRADGHSVSREHSAAGVEGIREPRPTPNPSDVWNQTAHHSGLVASSLAPLRVNNRAPFIPCSSRCNPHHRPQRHASTTVFISTTQAKSDMTGSSGRPRVSVSNMLLPVVHRLAQHAGQL
jgi:hypothetical protein